MWTFSHNKKILYSVVFQPLFSSQHMPHLTAWASSTISLIVFDDAFPQRSLLTLKDCLESVAVWKTAQGMGVPEVGGGRVAYIEQGCVKIESEVCKWRPEAHHVTMGCLPRNLLSSLKLCSKNASHALMFININPSITFCNQEAPKSACFYIKRKSLKIFFIRKIQPCYSKRLLHAFIIFLLYFQVICWQKQLQFHNLHKIKNASLSVKCACVHPFVKHNTFCSPFLARMSLASFFCNMFILV